MFRLVRIVLSKEASEIGTKYGGTENSTQENSTPENSTQKTQHRKLNTKSQHI